MTKTTLADNRFFSSPSNRIPLEIWTNIFIECLPSQQHIKPDPRSAPLLLCRVSKAWRSTALSLPNLWSSIKVDIYHNNDVERQAEDVELWLRRSGVRPLAVSLCLRGRDWTMDIDDEVDLDPILDLFISFIERWEDVQLDLVGPLCGSISSIHLLRAPLLRRFEVHFYPKADDLIDPLLSMLSTSPHLTEFGSYDTCDAEVPIAEFVLPWSQLTRFETDHYLEVGECFKVLCLCPNLVDCTFDAVATFGEPPPPIPHDVLIVRQHVHALTLATRDDNLYKFFDHLTLPALSALTLFSGDDWRHVSFEAFISRSGCSLKTIKLHITVSTDQLIVLLSLLPTLREFYIEGSEFDPLGNAFFNSLTYNETAKELCLCPALEVITLGGFIVPSNGMLAKMLKSRYYLGRSKSRRVACLQRVSVMLDVCRHGYDERVAYCKELKKIRKKGLDVTVDCYI